MPRKKAAASGRSGRMQANEFVAKLANVLSTQANVAWTVRPFERMAANRLAARGTAPIRLSMLCDSVPAEGESVKGLGRRAGCIAGEQAEAGTPGTIHHSCALTHIII